MRKSIAVPYWLTLVYPNCRAYEAGNRYIVVDPDGQPVGNGQDIAIIRYRGEQMACRFFRSMGQMVLLFDGQCVTVPEKHVLVIGKVVYETEMEMGKLPSTVCTSEESQAMTI